MLINYINKIAKVIAFCSLTMLTFTFLHSEIGLFDFDGNNHASHDYCEIVKITNAHSKLLKEELPKLEINKSLCLHCINETETKVVQVYFGSTNQPLILKQSAKAFLFNRTFLI